MKLTQTFNRSTLADTSGVGNNNNINNHTKYQMKTAADDSHNYNQSILQLQGEIKKLEIEKNGKLNKRKNKIDKYENMLKDNKSKFKRFESEIYAEETKLKEELMTKEKTYENLKCNINNLKSEIKELNFKLESNKSNEYFLLCKKKEKYLNKIKGKKSIVKDMKRKIRIILQKEKENRETNQMLREELDNSRKDMINITSKMESLMEFIDNMSKVSLISSGSSVTGANFTINVTYLEFQCINKQKLSKMIYDKLHCDPTPSQSVSLNNFYSFKNFKDASINVNNPSQNKSNREIFSNKLDKVYMSQIKSQNIQSLISKIADESTNYFKNKLDININLDLEMLIKSFIKFLFYDYITNIRMNYINKMTPIVENNNQLQENEIELESHYSRIELNKCSPSISKEIQNIMDKISQKESKLKILTDKIKNLKYEESLMNKESYNNRCQVDDLQVDIESMKTMQDNIKCDIICLEEDLLKLKRKYEEEKNMRKEERIVIKNKMEKVQKKIEKSNNKYEMEIDLLRNKVEEEGSKISNIHIPQHQEYPKYPPKEKSLNLNSNSSFSNSYRQIIKKPHETYSLYSNYLIQPAEKEVELIYDKKNDTYRIPPKNEVEIPTKNNFIYTKKPLSMNNQNRNKLNCDPLNNFTTSNIPKPKIGNSTKLGLDIVYNNNISKQNLLLTEKIRPLLEGSMVYKRTFYSGQIKLSTKKGFKASQFEQLQYFPIINWTIVPPEDYNFAKCFINIDRSITKLSFTSIPTEENHETIHNSKYFEIYLSSISKIVVPTITKNIIFVTQIYKKLKKRNIVDIEKYLTENKEKLIKLYFKGFTSSESTPVEIDEKLFNEDYRHLLLDSKKFIMYIYLKPDEETRLELIFEKYEDFKYWINGLEELLRNKEVKDIIRKKII